MRIGGDIIGLVFNLLMFIGVPPAIVVWIYDTFYNNFRIENDFTKYLMESCLQCSDEHFSFRYSSTCAFACKI